MTSEKIQYEKNCRSFKIEKVLPLDRGKEFLNTNGLLREFYPKGSDLSLVDENQLKEERRIDK